MEWDEIWHKLSLIHQGYPDAAIQAVLDSPEHQAKVLSEFERVSEDTAEMTESVFVLHAMHVLAQCREKKALRPMLRIAALPDDDLDAVLGDILTESFASCLASVCDDDALLQSFVENPAHADWARYIALDALTVRIYEGDLEPAPVLAWACALGERIVTRLQELKTDPDADSLPEFVANDLLLQGLADLIADTSSPDLLPLLQQWEDAGLLDEQHAGIDFYAEQIGLSLQERADRKITRSGRGYIRDTARKLRHWSCFNKRPPEHEKARPIGALPPIQPIQPIVNPAKVGRNDPCPCGSGKKYKKCCAA